MRGRKKESVQPKKDIELHPVERLMFLAEQIQDLSSQVLQTADEVRQEIQKHAK